MQKGQRAATTKAMVGRCCSLHGITFLVTLPQSVVYSTSGLPSPSGRTSASEAVDAGGRNSVYAPCRKQN